MLQGSSDLNGMKKRKLNIYVMQNIVVALRQAEFLLNLFFPFTLKQLGRISSLTLVK